MSHRIASHGRKPVFRRAAAALASVVTAALVLVTAPAPAYAQDAETLENWENLLQAQAPVFEVSPHSVPVVESLLGRGAELANDPAARVDLGAAAADQRSALVRITALEPTQDQTVLTGANASPVLFTQAGRTVSTVVLLPVTQGSVSLWSADPGAIRIEPLAYLGGATVSPGATHALDVPVRRADTGSLLGGPGLGAAPLWFGLTGEGGVPSTGVRSAYITLDIAMPAADRLVLSDGQAFDLPAGRSVVTTVVTVDDRGGVAAHLAEGTSGAGLTADVLGWVTEAALDTNRANLIGSYVASTHTQDVLQVSLRNGQRSAQLQLTDSLDSDYALVLVSGAATGSVASTVQPGAMTGRAQGTAVDPTLGITPQLALVPVTDEHGSFSMRQGDVNLTVLPLGGFLGDAQREHNDAAALTITSHHDGANVDISKTGYFTLAGLAVPGANSIDRIELSGGAPGNEEFVGTAQLSYDEDSVTWSVDAAAPADGTYTYTMSLFDRGDHTSAIATRSVTLQVATAQADDEVVTPEARVLNMGSIDFTVDEANERRALFASDPGLLPGEILVGGATTATPEGFLGRVTAINFSGGMWVIDTIEPQIEELIYQADIDEVIEFEDGEGADGTPIVVTDAAQTVDDQSELFSGRYSVSEADGQPEEWTAIDEYEPAPVGGDTDAALLTGNEVDLDLSVDDFETEHQADMSVTCASLANDPQEPRGEDIDDDGHWIQPSLSGQSEPCDTPLQGINISKTWSIGTDASLLFQVKNGKLLVQDQTKMTEEQKKAEKERAFGNKFGIAVKASGQASAALVFKLDVKFNFSFKKKKKAVEVKNFTVQIETAVKAQAALSIFAEANYKLDLSKKLGEVQLPSVTFLIGFVPVVVLNDFEIGLSVNAGIKATADLPVVGVSRSDTFGFTYSSAKGMSRIKHAGETKYANSFVQAIDPVTKVSISGWVAVGPEITFNSRIYKFAGPAMTLGAAAGVQVELEAPLDETTPMTAAVTIFLESGLNGQARLTLLRWELLSVTIFNLEWRTELWVGPWVVKKAKA